MKLSAITLVAKRAVDLPGAFSVDRTLVSRGTAPYVHILCTNIMYIYNVQIDCTYIMYIYNVHIYSTVYIQSNIKMDLRHSEGVVSRLATIYGHARSLHEGLYMRAYT